MNEEKGILQQSTNSAGTNSPWEQLLPALQRLDRLLETAVQNLQSSQRSDVGASFRGLYVGNDDVSRALAQSPGEVTFAFDRSQLGDAAAQPTLLASVASQFGLSVFDTDVLLLAFAPELDLRYERIFGYLQDDVTRKRPTVELALNLLCTSAEEKIQRRDRFSPEAPLLCQGLLHLVSDPNYVEPPFLARYLKLDEQVTKILLADSSLDPRLVPFCKLSRPTSGWNQVPLSEEIKRALNALVTQANANRQPLQLYFQGPPGAGKELGAEALAGSIGTRLLSVRADQFCQLPRTADLLPVLSREVKLWGAVLYVSAPDDVREQETLSRWEDVLDAIASFKGVSVVGGRKNWVPRPGSELAVKPVIFGVLDFAESRGCWKSELTSHSFELQNVDVEMIASRFRLTAGQIKTAVSGARLNSVWRSATGGGETTSPEALVEDLCAAARAQCGHELGRLAIKVEPRYGWEDIILPSDQLRHLREICVQAEYRKVVYADWGFDRKLSLGKGLNVLFTGPPGVGKTMGAEVIARELRLDLYRIDLSQVVSKYIGESEKNLDKIFTAAENSNAILFFDEADALFGKRSEVRDSHDRYANLEISYLLQKMEEYQGISILATNLRQNLDDAFMRRLQAVVEFPFPDEEFRARIWKSIFPAETPLADDVNFTALAREISLAGGNIKNIALVAAFSAAGDGGTVRMEHLVQAAHREYQKLGRGWDETELLKPQAVA